MAELHPEQKAGLAHLPTHLPVALLTRHSVREQSENRIAAYHLPLTPEGVALAESWGAQLGRPLAGFWSSPVGRCVDTAQALARGAMLEAGVEQTMTLVEPGCYVQSLRHVGPLFLELGPIEFANRHLSDPLPGVLTPREGAAKLLRHMQETMGEAGTLSVHVTHDTILSAFVYHLRGHESISEEDWPWMMEGAWVWFDGDHVHWVWRGEPGRRPMSDFQDEEEGVMEE